MMVLGVWRPVCWFACLFHTLNWFVAQSSYHMMPSGLTARRQRILSHRRTRKTRRRNPTKIHDSVLVASRDAVARSTTATVRRSVTPCRKRSVQIFVRAAYEWAQYHVWFWSTHNNTTLCYDDGRFVVPFPEFACVQSCVHGINT